MRKWFLGVFLLSFVAPFSIIAEESEVGEILLIPKPFSIEVSEGAPFILNPKTVIDITRGNSDLQNQSQYLQSQLEPACGFDIQQGGLGSSGNVIRLEIITLNDERLGEEGYLLDISDSEVALKANSPHGLFNGMQTLIQLLPAEIESDSIQNIKWSIPACQIVDYPLYSWRGLMFDVSRHFFTKDEVMKYIDTMSRYKFNLFHWHLTDDQGWRIEIKRYPELTEKGAWRVPREGSWWSFDPPQRGEKASYGGFYTQEEIKEVIAYAAERFITVVPEIDVPGHSLAILAGRPDLTCKGKHFDVNPGSKFWGKIPNTLCPGNEDVYTYLDGIFEEIIDLFPSEYIHIGGDEAYRGFWRFCRKCRKQRRRENLNGVREQQSYFIQRIEKMVEARGRKIIGWDEILEGGLADNAAVMSWRGIDGGVKSAQMKHPVVMSPSPYYYLDLFQGDPANEPDTYSLARLKTSYDFNPLPPEVDPQYILGVQGNLWTESVSEMRHAEYMTWPRSFAIAESGWINNDQKDWNGFQTRVEAHFNRFDQAKVNYAQSVYDVQYEIYKENGKKMIRLFTEFSSPSIHYTFDGADPDEFYPVYSQPIVIPKNPTAIHVVTYVGDRQVGRLLKINIE